MANYKEAERLTGLNEGGYVFDPNDKGGETYAGISRNNWPKWEGWRIIDTIKVKWGQSASQINRYAHADPNLHIMISKFYKTNFWDVNKLDLITDQQLANTVYDFGVNSGTSRAAKYLQQVLGVNQDGVVGPKTINAANSLDPEEAVTLYNSQRQAFYQSIAKGSQAKFLKSWLSRLKPYKP